MPLTSSLTFKPPVSWLDFFHARRRLFAAMALLFLVILSFPTVYRGAGRHKRTDFTVFLKAAEAASQRRDIYDAKTERQWNYVYLPLLAVLLIPFTGFPLKFTILGWYAISAAALWASFLLAMGLFRDRRQGFSAALAATVLCLPSILATLTRGQMGVLNLFFALAVYALYEKKQDFWAGVLLALGVTLKLSPLAPLGFFFLAKREWKACAGGIAGAFIFVILLPSLAVGFGKNWVYIQEWLRIMGQATSKTAHESMIWGQLLTPMAEDNQSLYAVLARIFWKTEENVIAHLGHWLGPATRLLGLAALAALSWISRKKRGEESEEKTFTAYALFAFLMILVSPVSENHHYTVLFLMILAAFSWDGPETGKKDAMTRAYAVMAAVAFLLGLIFEKLAYWGVPMWGAGILWAVLFACLAGDKQKLAGNRA
ncbi:MAG TPA: glycosyltransferase family 87 protein [Verrucomicrobiae bacterium]|jgi:hypothetical protein|nr:glycosyltransferase family 87 protein [Verrucomicrobiae bacterium]